MRIALDTNVVVRTVNTGDPEHGRVRGFVETLTAAGEDLCIAPQVIYEYWVVATRPTNVNGLGLSPAEARLSIDRILRSFRLLPDSADLVSRRLGLCVVHRVSGRAAHDGRLVAWMLTCDIRRLATPNAGDFSRYDEIECVRIA